MSNQQMIGEFKQAMKKNMKRLNEMAQGSLEMQQLLLQTGEKYIAQKKGLEEDGETLFTASQAKRARKSSGSAAAEAPLIEVAEGVTLRRGLRVYRNWGQKMCADFLGFIEPSIRTKVASLPLPTLQELIGFSCDLRLTGDVLDRVGNEDKKAVFEAGRQTYTMLGSRLGGAITIRAEMDWARYGHFDASSAPASLSVTCVLLGQTVQVNQDVLRGDPGPFTSEVEKNYSRFAAALTTQRDEYTLAGLFPRLSRSLLRRPSEVTGAAGSAISAATNAAEQRDDPDAHQDDDEVPEPNTT